MTTKNKVIHVEFTSGELIGQHHYFGSIYAIFSSFTPKQIGAGYSTVRNFKVEFEKPYVNKICIIRKGEINRKKGNRTAPVKIIRVLG